MTEAGQPNSPGAVLNTSIVENHTTVDMPAGIVPEVVHLHMQAFRGYMSARLGRGYIRAMIEWFRTYEPGIALIVKDEEGRLAGYVIGAPLGYGAAMNRDLLGPAIRATIARPWLLLDRRIRRTAWGRLKLLAGRRAPPGEVPELPPPTMSLVGIAVAPESQGRSIGALLVDAFESRAREKNAGSLRLSVYPNNPSARRLYEKCGWQPFREPPSPDVSMFYVKPLE